MLAGELMYESVNMESHSHFLTQGECFHLCWQLLARAIWQASKRYNLLVPFDNYFRDSYYEHPATCSPTIDVGLPQENGKILRI